MSRKIYGWISLLMFFLAGVMLTLLVSPAWASGNDVDVRQSNDMNNQTGGDISHESKALGFSHSLGDVDINQCLGSTQWGSIIVSKQKLVLNKWCAAEVYDAKGLHHMAAVMRCDIPEVAKHFPDGEHCVVANKWVPKVVVQDTLVVDDSHDEDEEEWHEEQIQLQQDYDERLAQLEERLSRPAPKVIERTVVEQKPWMTDEKRAALQKVLDE